MTGEGAITGGYVALAEGRWAEARSAFEADLETGETADAFFGLAAALWWLGENQAAVDRCGRAYSLFRESGDVERAAQCAVWLAITYKANFANFVAANGWIGRAERLLELEPGPLHGWVWVARGYRMADLETAEDLTARAVGVARSARECRSRVGRARPARPNSGGQGRNCGWLRADRRGDGRGVGR